MGEADIRNDDALTTAIRDLSSSDPNVVHDAYIVVKHLVAKSEFLVMLRSGALFDVLKNGLLSPKEKVVAAVLLALTRLTSSREDVTLLFESGLFSGVVACLNSPSTGVCLLTLEFFASLARGVATFSPSDLGILRSESFLSRLHEISQENSTSRLRVQEVILHMARHNSAVFACSDYGPFFRQIRDNLNAIDPLATLATAETLKTTLAQSSMGVRFATEQNLLSALFTMLDTPDASLLGPILLLSLAEFVARAPDLVLERVDFFSKLHTLLSTDETPEDVQEACISSFGVVCTSVAGLERGGKLLPLVSSFVVSGRTILRNSARHSLASVLENTRDSDRAFAVFNHVKRAISGGDVVCELMACMDSALLEDHYASFHFLVGMATHVWGVPLLFGHPGFLSWLVDQKSEPHPTGKSWKYHIALTTATLAPANNWRGALDEAQQRELQQFLTDGMYEKGSIEPRADVAKDFEF